MLLNLSRSKDVLGFDICVMVAGSCSLAEAKWSTLAPRELCMISKGNVRQEAMMAGRVKSSNVAWRSDVGGRRKSCGSFDVRRWWENGMGTESLGGDEEAEVGGEG